jgi:hypothetical protein
MTVLSLVAIGRLAERHLRQADQPVPVEQVVRWLVDAFAVDLDRAQAGVRLAVTVGRLEAIGDNDGRPCLQLPNRTTHNPKREAA